MAEPHWQFAPTGGGPEDGVNNPTLQHFEGDYNYYLAREILQNALDARHDHSKPVEVDFSLVHLRQSQFPGFQGFVETWQAAKAHWPASNKKCHAFLDEGLRCLGQTEIRVLKISDRNALGLSGEDGDRDKPWFNLVKSIGSTTKDDDEGGSFGIGKGAPFAASTLRTCFYSTINDTGRNVFQGIAQLVSHKKGVVVMRGIGSYGMPNQSSIRDRLKMEEAMVRKGRGLDIFVMGYKVQDDWQEMLLLSVLRNFWLAIAEKELIVRIDGLEVSDGTIDELLTKHFLDKPYKDSIKPEGNPLEYLKAYRNGRRFDQVLPLLGLVRFHFNLTDQPLNRVAMVRKQKMVIYTRRFDFAMPYAGVFICDNKDGNSELRKMENPEHDEWIAARYKEKGQQIEDELRGFIRACLREMAAVQESGQVEIPGLHRYLPFELEEDDSQLGGTSMKYSGRPIAGMEETARELGAVEAFDETVTISPYRVQVLNERKAGFDGTGDDVPKSNKSKTKKKRRRGGEGDKDALLRENLRTRVFCVGQTGDTLLYKLIARSSIDGRCSLKLTAIGEEVSKAGGEKIILRGQAVDGSGNQYQTSGHRILNVPISSNDALHLDIQVEGNMRLALNIEAYALQQ